MPTAQPGELAPRKGSSSGTSSSLTGAVTHHGIQPPPGTVALTPLLPMGMMPPTCLGAVWGGWRSCPPQQGALSGHYIFLSLSLPTCSAGTDLWLPAYLSTAGQAPLRQGRGAG